MRNCFHFFQVLFENTFMYLQNHIQSFISPSISFLSYHFKLTFRGNHSRTSFSHCPFSNKWTRIPVRSAPDASILPVSSTHAFPLLACLLRLCPRPISNSQLHALRHFHLCPINLIVFKGSYFFRMGVLILRGASRLDAFSVYPFQTWLPGHRPGGLTGTPVVCPSRSSRTKDSSFQNSSAHAG